MTLLRKTREYDRLWESSRREVTRRGCPSRRSPARRGGDHRPAEQRPIPIGQPAFPPTSPTDDLKCLVDAGLLVATSDERGRLLSRRRPGEGDPGTTRDPILWRRIRSRRRGRGKQPCAYLLPRRFRYFSRSCRSDCGSTQRGITPLSCCPDASIPALSRVRGERRCTRRALDPKAGKQRRVW